MRGIRLRRELAVCSRQLAVWGLKLWRLVGLQSPSPDLRPPSPPGEGIIKKHPSPGGEGAPEGRMRGGEPGCAGSWQFAVGSFQFGA